MYNTFFIAICKFFYKRFQFNMQVTNNNQIYFFLYQINYKRINLFIISIINLPFLEDI